MQWLKRIFKRKTPRELKLEEIERLRKLAFDAQRKGDLAVSGQYELQIETLYKELELLGD
jgi:hypothetical protein